MHGVRQREERLTRDELGGVMYIIRASDQPLYCSTPPVSREAHLQR